MKIYYILVFIISVTFLACSEEGEVPEPDYSNDPNTIMDAATSASDDDDNNIPKDDDDDNNLASADDDDDSQASDDDDNNQAPEDDDDDTGYIDENDAPPKGTDSETKTSGFKNISPAFAEALASTPPTVIINFSKPLLEGSYIKVYKDKEPVTAGDSKISNNDTTLSVPIDTEKGPGVYDIVYNSVHDSQDAEKGYSVFYVEVREYKGETLDSILNFRENSIKGPQYVSPQDLLFKVDGLVDNELTLNFENLLKRTAEKRVKTLNCVEGWFAKVLWEGVYVEDLLVEAIPKEEATIAIFYALDGYTTSLPLSYLTKNKILLAFKMNEVAMPAMRGFPLQLVAEDKWGYKWIKWVVRIELSDDEDFRGFWEGHGYNNDGSLDGPIFEQ